jgi:uncharacterized membrane protein YgaE (UPF0421/DUF939 family)
MTFKETQDGNAASLSLVHISHAVGQGAALAIACLITYALITRILTRAYFITRDDDLLGGMWAVAATVFVYRESYKGSARAALSRMMATLLSFVLCLAYLLIFPFHPWGMAALIGIGATVLTLVGRPRDIITTGITTTVVMVVAGMGSQHAWREPILRLVDTAVGTAVGTAAAWISLKLGSRPRPAPLTLEQSTSAVSGNWKGRT